MDELERKRIEPQSSDASDGAQQTQGNAPHDIENLDVLRAVAVCAVFVSHLFAVLNLRALGTLGHFGVLLFFVHTSLVLMMSMDRMKLRGAALYRAFAIRRAFRLYPLSIACVLLFIGFQIPSAFWLGPFLPPDASTTVSNLLLVQNLVQERSVNCVLWSLPFEVQMYALLPFAFLFIRAARPAKEWRAALIVMTLGLVIACAELAIRGTVEGSLTRYVPCFLCGIVTWVALKRQAPRYGAGYWLIALAALLILYRLAGIVRVYGPDPTSWASGGLRTDGGMWWPPIMDPIRDWVFCGAVAILIPLFRSCRHPLVIRPSKVIAKYSYGIYLWHVPMLWLVFDVMGIGRLGAVPAALLVIMGTSLVSVLGFHFLEDPAVRLGKRIANRTA